MQLRLSEIESYRELTDIFIIISALLFRKIDADTYW